MELQKNVGYRSMKKEIAKIEREGTEKKIIIDIIMCSLNNF